MPETGARRGTPNQRATYDSFSANPPLDRNLMPRQNWLYREGATSIFLVPGAFGESAKLSFKILTLDLRSRLAQNSMSIFV